MEDILATVLTILILAVPCAFLTFWFYKAARYWGLAGGLVVLGSLLLETFFPVESVWRGYLIFFGFVLPLLGAHLRIRKLQKERDSLKELVDQY